MVISKIIGNDGGINVRSIGLRKYAFLCFVALWLGALGLPQRTFGQATTGSISGIVLDSNQGSVPNADVKITNVETGAERGATTSAEGLFAVPRLALGNYVVRVTKQGFRVYEVHSVTVVLGQDTNLRVVLEIGNVSETVTVEGSSPLVETTTAQTTATFDNKQIAELPALSGRLDAIALLSPGVIPGFGNVNSNGTTLSVNGQRSRSNNFTIDGQDNNDNFSAEYGRNQGAIVNLVTKSGTNTMHGALYGYHQNSRLFANIYENDRDGLPKPRFNDNTDGGAVGGPFKQDKAFYFFNFQSDQSKAVSTNTSASNAFVITPNGLATLIGKCGPTNTLTAYRDHGPFAQAIGNPVVLAGSASTTRSQSQYVPLASGDPCGGAAFSFETGRVTRTVPTPFNQYDWGMKYDFIISQKNTLNVRYLFQDGVTKNANFSSAGYEIDVPFRSQNLGVTFTRQMSSRQVNEFRFNYGRLSVAFEGANTFKLSEISKNIARFTMPSGFLSFGLATNLPQNRKVNTYQFVDNWSILAGRHSLKTGVDVRRQLTPAAFLPQINGAFSFNRISPFIRNNPALEASPPLIAAGDLTGLRAT